MLIERKQYGATVEPESGNTGVVEALVSVFGNTDNANEVMIPGAFKASLERRKPKGVWAHKWDTPIAKTLEAREVGPGEKSSNGGLYIKGQFNLETQAGREAYSNIKFGIIDEFSIGYRVLREAFPNDMGTRELHEVELFEWSPVLVGMNPATELLSVKAPASGDSINPTNERATFAYQADFVRDAIKAFANRAKVLQELRAKEGRVISEANRERIRACIQAIQSLQPIAADLEGLLALSEPPQAKAPEGEVRAIYAEYLKTMGKYL
jgi:HK97 family phage prohead protease